VKSASSTHHELPERIGVVHRFDNCTCTFQGQTGAASIRAYGTVTPNGVLSGTFLITSGGGSVGTLSTLAGYGTFSSWGQRTQAGDAVQPHHIGSAAELPETTKELS